MKSRRKKSFLVPFQFSHPGKPGRIAGVVHPGPRLTRYIYDELSFLSYPKPCGSVVDVNTVNQNAKKTRSWYCLLPVFLGIILFVQACSAIAPVKMDVSISPNNTFLGNSVTINTHLYAPDYPGVVIAGQRVELEVLFPDNSSGAVFNDLTNASGWVTHTYTPPTIDRYRVSGRAYVNSSIFPGLPPNMVLNGYGGQFFNVTRFSVLNPTIQPGLHLTVITTTPTTEPVTTTQTPQQTTPVTQVTQTTPVTQAIPALQGTSTIPASQSDTTPPVTTLTLAGTEDGSGGYSSDVIGTLTAADNTNGSGVKVTQYSFDGTSWYTYSQPVSVVRAGMTTLYYRSADNAGNVETAHVKAITISGPGAAPSVTPVPAAAPTQTGSGSSLPLWLIALVIIIIIAAVGVVLYGKSRQKEEPKK